jgi:ribosome assembly protein RRB1
MPKRAAVDARPGPEKASRSISGQAREKPAQDEMGEFEDAWEDDIEDEDAAAQGGDGALWIYCSGSRVPVSPCTG